MISLEKINEALNAFAVYVKLSRLREKWSLRDFSKETKLSHTFLNKVENVSVKLTKSSYEKITRAFKHNLREKPELVALIESRKVLFHEAVFYNDQVKIEKIYAELKPHETYYFSSLQLADYLLIMQGYAYMRNVLYNEHNTQYDEYLYSVVERLSKDQEPLFYMYRGLSRYKFNDIDKALKDLLTAIDITTDNKIHALSGMIIGRIYSDQYKLFEAEHYFKKTRIIYERYNHFMSSVYIKVYEAITQLKLQRFESLDRDFKNLLSLSDQIVLKPFKNLILSHYMYYKLALKEYQEVIKFSDSEIDEDARFYFYYAFAEHHLKNTLNTDFYNDVLKHQPSDAEDEMYQTGLRFVILLNAQGTMNKSNFQLAENYFNKAISIKYYLDAQLMFPYIIEYYTKTRQYKKAHELNLLMINIMRGK